MEKFKNSTKKFLIWFNKLLIFPLCITYIIINFVTVLNYLSDIFYTPKYGYYDPYWDVCEFFYNHGLNKVFYFFEDLGMRLSHTCNSAISVILTLMMITDMIFSIRSGKKQIVKWILYGIITIIILFIGFGASPAFYDSV